MNPSLSLDRARFPRASAYHPDWILAGVSGGANPLWLVEWLSEAIELRPGMRVLDLGCGRAMSSIFLRREFDVQVWATDLWFSPDENLQRIQDAGVADGVFTVRADARSLPFAAGYFDVITSVDSFVYYGTDEFYLNYLARFLKPGGQLGIVGTGLAREFGDGVPEHLREWWAAERPGGMHSAAWWKQHWEKTGILDVHLADALLDGWRLWLDWIKTVAPENLAEWQAIETDAGRHLAYVRVVGRLREQARLFDPSFSIPPQYVKKPLLRDRR